MSIVENEFRISISPKGTLWISGFGGKTSQLANAFELGEAEGFYQLLKSKIGDLPLEFKFWHRFASEAIHQRVMDADWLELIDKKDFPLREGELQEFYLTAPPISGWEYLTLDRLGEIWSQWNHHLNRSQEEDGIVGREFIAKHFPYWAQVGKVTFHLAENKKSVELPFAFMATFSSGISKSTGGVLHQPLGKALQESSKTGDREKLVRLLVPVKEASKRCSWVDDLIRSKKIFQPQAWTVREAHQFLHSISALEESGLTVRTPNWWKGKKTSRATVSVVIDTEKKETFNIRDMLRFNLNYSVGGEPLTAEEIEKILASTDGLVSIRGEWIEADAEQLQSAMARWERARKIAEQGGMSFNEAMRLLSGVQMGAEVQDEADEEARNWEQIIPGEFFKKILDENRGDFSDIETFLDEHLCAQLRPYQKEGVEWLLKFSRLGFGLCLADDMGLGKTIQIISLLLLFHKRECQEVRLPSLLVVPSSLLGNWSSEIEKFAPSLRYLILHPSELGSGYARKMDEIKAQLDVTDVVITTYGQVVRLKEVEELEWNLVCLDEAQAIKNSGTRQTRSVKKLNGRYRIALTGTPIENRLGDLWSLFDFINPGLLGSTSEFKSYLGKLNSGESPNYQPLRKLVTPYIKRRLKTDKSIISDLPDKTELKVYCNLSKSQAIAYESLVKELVLTLKDAKESQQQRRAVVLTYLMRFKQLCNHYSQYSGDLAYDIAGSGKFERLKSIVEEVSAKQEKMLVFTQFKEMVGPLAELLEELFGASGLTLDGSTSVKKRKELVASFQKDHGAPFFVLSIKAGGTGLNLTEACHVVHFDRWWNPAVEDQATDRAFRIGQKKNVMVHKFVCKGTIEEKIDRLIFEKRALSKEILEGASAEKGLTEMSDEELMEFVQLDPLRAVRGSKE